MSQVSRKSATATCTHIFSYHNYDGEVVAQKLRWEPGEDGREKDFRPRQRVGINNGHHKFYTNAYRESGMWWINRLADESIKALPYNLSELVDEDRDYIWATEGEPDANAVREQGELATTILQNGYEQRWAGYFRGYEGVVRLIVDRDEDNKGYRLGWKKARALLDNKVTIEAYQPPEGYKDVRELLEDGGTLSDLEPLSLKELERLSDEYDHSGGTNGEVGEGGGYPGWVFFEPFKGQARFTPIKSNDKAESSAIGRQLEWKPRKTLPSPEEPMAVARQVEKGLVHKDAGLMLYHWNGTWMEWRRSHWYSISSKYIRSKLWVVVEHAKYEVEKDGKPVWTKWRPNTSKLNNLLDALSAIVYLDEEVEAGSWLVDNLPAGRFVSCLNGLVEVRTRKIHPHTPSYFNLVAVPFDYNPNAPEPKRWLEFLNQQWADDPVQILILQEWFGYIISGRTDLQKILAIFGAPRSGKGTIGRILVMLLGGKRNVAGPTLKSLGERFGLQNLIGKPLATMSDLRLGDRADVDTIVERLLTISGEDQLDIDRKNKDPWSGRLPTRIMMLSNEEPAFRDASGAIASRFIPLQHKVSFLGREDPDLYNKLLPELPGILNWALEGLDRLERQGRFTDSIVSKQIRDRMRGGANRAIPFIEEMCDVGSELWCLKDELWSIWQAWAREANVAVGTKQSFGRLLHNAIPEIDGDGRVGGKGRQKRIYQGIAPKETRKKKVSDGR